ncbi:MAG: hypothetical protein AAF558_07300 [Verrucomicrobiota bacterium]
MPIQQAMPDEWKERLVGRLSGNLTWNTSEDGLSTIAEGEAALRTARLQDWAWLNELARFHGNSELRAFDFDEIACEFFMNNQKFEVSRMTIFDKEKFNLTGSGEYNRETKQAKLDVAMTDMPVVTWLPDEFKPRVEATVRGTLKWEGSLDRLEGSRAEGHLDLSGAEVTNPVRMRALLSPHGISVPDTMNFKQAMIDFAYEEGTFSVDRMHIDTDAIGRLDAQGSFSKDDQFSVTGELADVDIVPWLPDKVAGKVSGVVTAQGTWSCHKWNLEKGSGLGRMMIEDSTLKRWAFQNTLVRFFKDKSWLQFDFEPATFSWVSKKGEILVEDIWLFCPDKFGVVGHLRRSPDNALQGKVQIGVAEKNLTWLPEATTAVFKTQRDGLHWADVSIAGTIERPEHDLGRQVVRVLLRHPIALLGLAGRGVSWWLGDVLGTYEAPQLESPSAK